MNETAANTLANYHHDLTYHAEMDLALTYALRRPDLARACATKAAIAAVRLSRPDLRHAANELLAAINL